MGIFKKLKRVAKKGARLAVKNPEIALIILGAVAPKLARKAGKVIQTGEQGDLP
jgi:hypothetical protein